MTSAKPQPMAGQTQGPDDLIAELAKLMADDMRSEKSDKPEKPAAAPFRLPGAEPAAEAEARPADPLSLLEALTRQTNPAPAAEERPVRIPGAEPAMSPAAPTAAAPPSVSPPREKPAGATDFAFNFKLPSDPVVAGPAQPIAPSSASPASSSDSIADLIAAELALQADEPAPAPVPVPVPSARPRPENSFAPLSGANAQGPRSEADAFGVPPVFGLGSTEPRASGTTAPPVVTPPSGGSVRIPSNAVPVPVRQEPSRDAAPPVPVADFSADDPLAEIERLVNSAVRLDTFRPTPPPEPKPLEVTPRPEPVVAVSPRSEPAPEPVRADPPPAPVVSAPTPSPALRSLATPREPVPTPVAPKPEPVPVPRAEPAPALRAEPESPKRPMETSVDEAILAAAAATGARIDWVEGEDESVERPAPRARNNRILGMTRSFAGPLVALTLLVAAGLGLYWVLGQTGAPSDEPAPLIAADTTPVKEVPEATAEPAPQSVVFNEISGVDTGSQEQIVSRDQTDIAAIDELTTPAAEDEGLVNRKVRTVTVRPDGTIVSGDDSLAGAAILPVDRPDVPEVPGANFSTPEMVANVDAAATATVPEIAQPAPAPTTPAVTPVVPGSTVPAVDLAGTPLTGRTAPVPFARPDNFAALSANALAAAAAAPVTTEAITPATTPLAAPTQPAPAVVETPAPVAAATPAVTTAPATAAAYAQLASLRSEADAQAVAQRITTRFGVLFGSSPVEIRRVDLGERGIYYRVVVPADSRQTASNICVNVKAAGGDCVLQ